MRCVIEKARTVLTVEVASRYARLLMTTEVSKAHPLDTLIAWLSSYSKLFSHGWGDESLLAALSRGVSHGDLSVPIHVQWISEKGHSGTIVNDGIFESPLRDLPPKVCIVHV